MQVGEEALKPKWLYNGILLSHRKRWNTAICDNMDGSWNNHTKQNKPDRKGWKSCITYIWDINLKATNEQDKQRLMDMDNGLMVTGGEGEERRGKKYEKYDIRFGGVE